MKPRNLIKYFPGREQQWDEKHQCSNRSHLVEEAGEGLKQQQQINPSTEVLGYGKVRQGS